MIPYPVPAGQEPEQEPDQTVDSPKQHRQTQQNCGDTGVKGQGSGVKGLTIVLQRGRFYGD